MEVDSRILYLAIQQVLLVSVSTGFVSSEFGI